MTTEIELYKIARNSIEHFDKILSDFRKIIFAFNGILFSSIVTYFAKAQSAVEEADTVQIFYRKFFVASVVVAGINIIVWLLEKHYHRYLISSANVAKEIEKRFDVPYRLTSKLEETKQFKVDWPACCFKKRANILIKTKDCFIWLITLFVCIFQYIFSKFHLRSYDLLYISPLVLSALANYWLAIWAVRKADNSELFLFSNIALAIYIIVSMLIIRHNYCYEEWARKKGLE